MDYLRVIRLGYGKGEPGKQACWMTALQAHMNGEWTDRCDCVDPAINALCIAINDSYAQDHAARTEDILNFGLFRVIGTRGTLEDTERRACLLADRLVRYWLPAQLRALIIYTLQAFPGHAAALAPIAGTIRKLDACSPIRTYADLQALQLYTAQWRLVISALESYVHGWTSLNHVVSTLADASTAARGENEHSQPLGVSAAGVRAAQHIAGSLEFLAEFCATIKVACPGNWPYASAREFLCAVVFPTLAEMIKLGPHETKEMPEPACGIPEFHRLCGVQ